MHGKHLRIASPHHFPTIASISKVLEYLVEGEVTLEDFIQKDLLMR